MTDAPLATRPDTVRAPERALHVVILGLSVSSSWGNGHATTYRCLIKELGRAGHRVSFLERDVPWYAENRDDPSPAGCQLNFYQDLPELRHRWESLVREADAVILGSYVPDGVAVAEWLTRTARGVVAFYDIDTPVTLAKLARKDESYLVASLIPRFDLYLSFTGGPTLVTLEKTWGARQARPLYCSVDADTYAPSDAPQTKPLRWDMGYLGTYSEDRQPVLQRLMLASASQRSELRFVVAGPSYPSIAWPSNVERIEHLAPPEHPAFYRNQRFTLNVTRADMVAAGYSPSVRLFEAAACGTPIISDAWEGIETFFEPGKEILLADSTERAQAYLLDLPEDERRAIAQRARARVLAEHTATQRATTLVRYLRETITGMSRS